MASRNQRVEVLEQASTPVQDTAGTLIEARMRYAAGLPLEPPRPIEGNGRLAQALRAARRQAGIEGSP